MRRGALNQLCAEQGMNKLALGHHRDDAIETLFMSMLYEGRIHTFHPVTYLSRTGITQIRPLCYLPEKHIIHMARTLNLPVVPSPCPANGFTKREEIKTLLDGLCRQFPNARSCCSAPCATRTSTACGSENPSPRLTLSRPCASPSLCPAVDEVNSPEIKERGPGAGAKPPPAPPRIPPLRFMPLRCLLSRQAAFFPCASGHA